MTVPSDDNIDIEMAVAIHQCQMTQRRALGEEVEKAPAQATQQLRRFLLASHFKAKADSSHDAETSLGTQTHFLSPRLRTVPQQSDTFEEMYTEAMGLDGSAASFDHHTGAQDDSSPALRDPGKVGVSNYVKTQLRALHHSMEKGLLYHEDFNKHVAGVRKDRLELRQNRQIARWGTNYLKENRQREDSPRSLLAQRKARATTVGNRAQVDDGQLALWFSSQIELRKQVSSNAAGSSGREDVFGVVAKKWAQHVMTATSSSILLQSVTQARREREESRSKMDLSKASLIRSIRERSRYWTIVRRALKEYIIRYKRRKYGVAASLLVRFCRHYRQVHRVVRAISHYRANVILTQQQVRHFFRMREARRVLLSMQYIAAECAMLGVENNMLRDLSGAASPFSQGGGGRDKRSSISLTAATVSYVKERRLRLCSRVSHPSIDEMIYVPPGGSPLDVRYRWACGETTKLLKLRRQEYLHYERQLLFYSEERRRYGQEADDAGVPPPRRPPHPIQFLFASPDLLKLAIQYQQAKQPTIMIGRSSNAHVVPPKRRHPHIPSFSSPLGSGSPSGGGRSKSPSTASPGRDNAVASPKRVSRLPSHEEPPPTSPTKKRSKSKKRPSQTPTGKPRSTKRVVVRTASIDVIKSVKTDEAYASLLGKANVQAMRSFLDSGPPAYRRHSQQLQRRGGETVAEGSRPTSPLLPSQTTGLVAAAAASPRNESPPSVHLPLRRAQLEALQSERQLEVEKGKYHTLGGTGAVRHNPQPPEERHNSSYTPRPHVRHQRQKVSSEPRMALTARHVRPFEAPLTSVPSVLVPAEALSEYPSVPLLEAAALTLPRPKKFK